MGAAVSILLESFFRFLGSRSISPCTTLTSVDRYRPAGGLGDLSADALSAYLKRGAVAGCFPVGLVSFESVPAVPLCCAAALLPCVSVRASSSKPVLKRLFAGRSRREADAPSNKRRMRSCSKDAPFGLTQVATTRDAAGTKSGSSNTYGLAKELLKYSWSPYL